MPILLFKNIEKKLGKDFVLNIENFQLNEGEILVLLGPNGAGKTTTLKLAANLLKPDKGEISFLDKNLNKDFDEVKEYIGYVPDEITLYDFLKVEEFINFLIESYGLEKNSCLEKIDYLNKKLFISDYKNQLVKDLSLGTKQRLGIFSAMLKSPKILVVDEPLMGLDPFFVSKAKELFKEFATIERGALLMSTHLLNIAEELSTRICVILSGKIFYNGSINELKTKFDTTTDNLNLETLFLKILHEKR